MREHRDLIYDAYKILPPDILKHVRSERTEKFAPIFNQRLRKGIVVDLGCGTGTYVKLIRGRKVVGMDFVLDRVKAAKESCLSHDEFVMGDMEYLPFRRESVDAFFSFCSIYCLLPRAQYKLFKQLHSTLKKGGNILLVEPNAMNPRAEKEPKYPLHARKVRRQLEQIGFRNVKIEYLDFIPQRILIRGGIVLRLFRVPERILELLHIRWAGTLVVYAEKIKER